MILHVPIKPASPDFLKSLGERLALLRKSRGLTQTELAEAVDVKQYVIASYETGRNQMPISLIHPIASTLDVSVAELLGEVPINKRPGRTPKLVQRIDQISELPKITQKKILDVIEDMLVAAKAKAS